MWILLIVVFLGTFFGDLLKMKWVFTKEIKNECLEEYFGKKVYLDLFVKVIPKWRDKEKFLNMIGYKDFLNK